MDYTNRPQTNLSPGAFNLELLASIYGNATMGIPTNRGTEEEEIPQSIVSRYNTAVHMVESMPCPSCLVDLGDGYHIEAFQLSTFK
jgi:hypothetical protein